MNRSKHLILTAAVLVQVLAGHAAFAQSTPPSQSSVRGSQTSDTRANDPRKAIGACAAAVDELKAARAANDALEAENAALAARLGTEKNTTALLSEINKYARAETAALDQAIKAKDEALAAKDAALAADAQLIAILKRKRRSPWSRIGDVMMGAAIVAILK